VTPAYLERIGYRAGQSQSGGIPYGVVFEEWQGGLHACSEEHLNLSELVPIIRSGRPQHLNLSQFSSGFVRHGMLDFRDNNRDAYERGLDKIKRLLPGLDVLKNTFSSAEPRIWCATYMEWARVRFPERSRIPVDVWWFDTGAANEFLGAVGEAMHKREALWYDVDNALCEWQEDLRAEQARVDYRLTYADVASHVGWARRAQGGEHGWDHLRSTARFARAAIDGMSAEDRDIRPLAYHDTGLALMEIGEKFGDTGSIREAVHCFKSALDDASPVKPDQWLRMKSNCGHALRMLARAENDLALRKEALACYEDVLRASDRSNESHWRTDAEKAIEEIAAELMQ
jgi:hypothetical protein